jgi:hypothetical protein
MLCRNHPLMSYKDAPSWPPAWLRTGGYDTTHPNGEEAIPRAMTREEIEKRIQELAQKYVVIADRKIIN